MFLTAALTGLTVTVTKEAILPLALTAWTIYDNCRDK